MTATKASASGAGNVEATAKRGGSVAKLETCHPSVCIGGAKPTSCVCPTPEKK
jgi:hypothetical protein